MSAPALPARPGLVRPARDVLIDLGVRAALVVAAAIAAAAGASPWARTPLSVLAAVAVVTALVARSGRRGALHGTAVVVGTGLVALVLLGFALNLLPGGLSAPAWAVAVGLLELGALAGAALVPARIRPARRIPVAGVLWAALAVLVLAGAVVWSVASFDATHRAPVAMSVARSGDRATVTVTAGTAAGPYELDLVTDRGRTVVARGLRVDTGASRTVAVTLPAGARGLLQLLPAGSTVPTRQLVVDAGTSR